MNLSIVASEPLDGDEVGRNERFRKTLNLIPRNVPGLRQRIRIVLSASNEGFNDTSSLVNFTSAYKGAELVNFLQTFLVFTSSVDVHHLAGALSRLTGKLTS